MMTDIFDDVKKVFPSLTTNTKKGESGVVGVIGGSVQYTGAPYYAAMSSLKMGGDLAHIFCSKSAANAIKCYSPELIVHPVFVGEEVKMGQEELAEEQERWLAAIAKHFPRIHSWVIGPGLGRDSYMHEFFPKLIEAFPESTTIVFDADALYFLCQHPQLFKKLSSLKAILTPNHRQFHHLNKHLQLAQLPEFPLSKNSILKYEGQVSENLPAIIVKKGEVDVIMGKSATYTVALEGSKKRCGGIGDILAGCVALGASWNSELGVVLGCTITKCAANSAFLKEHRSLTAPDILKQLPKVVFNVENSSL